MAIDRDVYCKAVTRLNKVEEMYKLKFGEHSLDRVVLCDPLAFDSPDEHLLASLKKAINKLQKALNNNKPIEQIPNEMWGKIIF